MLIQSIPYPASSPEINPVSLENESASETTTDGSTATASFTVRTDRTVKDQDGVNLDPKWLDAGYSASDYQIRVTKNSGTTPSGDSLGSWLSLSSNRSWSLSQSGGAAGSVTCQLTVEIRDAASPNTVRDTATYTLTADSQSGGGAVDWNDINKTATTSSITANGNSQTMGAAGTLTIGYSGAGLTLTVNKNGVGQGADTSVPVVSGDTISFTASGNAFALEENRTGTITVSGLYSDSISVSLTRSTA